MNGVCTDRFAVGIEALRSMEFAIGTLRSGLTYADRKREADVVAVVQNAVEEKLCELLREQAKEEDELRKMAEASLRNGYSSVMLYPTPHSSK